MAKTDNLTDFLTDVANAIREKKGTSEPINPQNFSDAIKTLGGGLDRNLRYFNVCVDIDENNITLWNIYYSKIYNDTGYYDVTIPNDMCGLPVIVNSTNGIFGFFSNYHVQNINIGENVRYKNNTMYNAFASSSNLISPITIPNGVTNIQNAFSGCDNYNHPMVIPPTVTDMSSTFRSCVNFNSPVTISNGVVNMFNTFSGCFNFNQPIIIPATVVNMQNTFGSCWRFNQSITIPNNVKSIVNIFVDCKNFNSPVTISNGVTNMHGAFKNCPNFNQPIVIPPTVTDIGNLFNTSNNFNQPITIPNGVTNMEYAFNCLNFTINQPMIIPATVVNMQNTFRNCKQMNGDIVIYAENVTNALGMFNGRNTSNKINIFVPSNTCNTYKTLTYTVKTSSLTNAVISWTNIASDYLTYNTSRNIYIYYNLEHYGYAQTEGTDE